MAPVGPGFPIPRRGEIHPAETLAEAKMVVVPAKVRPPLRHNPHLKGGHLWAKDKKDQLNDGPPNDEPRWS